MIEAKLVRDTEVRTTAVTLNVDTGECRTQIETARTVRLALGGAPVMVTGRSGGYRYQPDLLTLTFADGKLTSFKTYGVGIRKDGTLGKLQLEDDFSPNGERRYYRDRENAPAEIMDIVRRYTA